MKLRALRYGRHREMWLTPFRRDREGYWIQACSLCVLLARLRVRAIRRRH